MSTASTSTNSTSSIESTKNVLTSTVLSKISFRDFQSWDSNYVTLFVFLILFSVCLVGFGIVKLIQRPKEWDAGLLAVSIYLAISYLILIPVLIAQLACYGQESSYIIMFMASVALGIELALLGIMLSSVDGKVQGCIVIFIFCVFFYFLSRIYNKSPPLEAQTVFVIFAIVLSLELIKVVALSICGIWKKDDYELAGTTETVV